MPTSQPWGLVACSKRSSRESEVTSKVETHVLPSQTIRLSFQSLNHAFDGRRSASISDDQALAAFGDDFCRVRATGRRPKTL